MTCRNVCAQPRSKEQVKNEAEILTWKVSPKQQELPLRVGEGKSLNLRRSHLERKKREKVVGKRGSKSSPSADRGTAALGSKEHCLGNKAVNLSP